jgi:hypothetical protein
MSFVSLQKKSLLEIERAERCSRGREAGAHETAHDQHRQRTLDCDVIEVAVEVLMEHILGTAQPPSSAYAQKESQHLPILETLRRLEGHLIALAGFG